VVIDQVILVQPFIMRLIAYSHTLEGLFVIPKVYGFEIKEVDGSSLRRWRLNFIDPKPSCSQ